MRLEITDVRTLTDAEPNVREMEFRGTPVSVGSGSDNLLQLPDVEIAARHATLRPMGEYWLYEPHTRGGDTKINGQTVADNTDLHDGDLIEVRYFTIRVVLDSELPVEGADAAQAAGDLAKIRQFPLQPRSVTRKPDATVSLNPARQKVFVDALMKLREVRNLATLLERVGELLLRELSGRVIWIGVRKDPHSEPEFIESRSDQGTVVGEPPNLETYTYRCLNRQQFITVPRTGHADTQSVLAVPFLGTCGTIGVVYLDTRKHTRVFDEGDLDFITLLTRSVTPLIEQFLESGALLPGMGEASPSAASGAPVSVQSLRAAITREVLPEWPQLDVAAFSKAGEESAGDLHDVMKLPNGLAAILLAHLDGEATRVAGMIGQVRGAFRIAGLHADPPHVQLKALNWLLYDENAPVRADAVVAVINPKTGAMEIGNAGKLGVLLLDAQGQPRKLGNPQAPPLGTQKSFDYVGSSERIDDDHTLAFFTRGCIKACKESGDPVGEKRFLGALCNNVGQPATAAIDDLLSDLQAYMQAGRAPDDITVVLAHRSGME